MKYRPRAQKLTLLQGGGETTASPSLMAELSAPEMDKYLAERLSRVGRSPLMREKEIYMLHKGLTTVGALFINPKTFVNYFVHTMINRTEMKTDPTNRNTVVPQAIIRMYDSVDYVERALSENGRFASTKLIPLIEMTNPHLADKLSDKSAERASGSVLDALSQAMSHSQNILASIADARPIHSPEILTEVRHELLDGLGVYDPNDPTELQQLEPLRRDAWLAFAKFQLPYLEAVRIQRV